MWFSLSQQTVYFLASIALGAALAMLYDLIRALRMLTRCSRVHLLVSDILFFFACGVLTSLFALPFNNGDVRAFIIFGEAVGFLTYRLTLGSLFGRFYAVIARLLRRFFRKICEILKKFYDFLLKAGAVLLYNIAVRVERIGRTALSGVRILIADTALGRSRKTKKKKPRRASRAKQIPQGIHTKYYEIPQIRDSYIVKKEEHEQKGSETRKKRKNPRSRRSRQR